MGTNPFTLVHDALWDMVTRHPEIEDLVKPGNRIQFNSETDRKKWKPQVQTSDLPELWLMPAGGSGNLFASSCDLTITRQWRFIIPTGDWRLSAVLMQVEWMLLTSLANWQTVAGEIDWQCGSTLVRNIIKDVRVPQIMTGDSDPKRGRQIGGWTSIWTTEVVMRLPRQLLKEIYEGQGCS